MNKEELFKETKPEFYFTAINGQEIKSLFELAYALERMSDDAYYYHVNDYKNDFSSWVKDVFMENNLSEQMKRAHGRLESAVVVFKFIIDNLK